MSDLADLTILCVTREDPYAEPFLAEFAEIADVIGADLEIRIDRPASGCIERVLDDAVAGCPDGWILRLDDDERPSVGMLEWLAAGGYRSRDHWAFRRMNLWPDPEHYVVSEPLWPDLQTRLSVKAKSFGRTAPHIGSPFGTGVVAPGGVVIEHHKFLVRSRAEREALVEHYESLSPGAGSGFDVFSVPERHNVTVAPR